MMRFMRTHALCLKAMAPFSKEDKVLKKLRAACKQKEHNAGQFVTISEQKLNEE